MSDEKWVVFYLDTNSVWGMVESREDWLGMKKKWVEWQSGRTDEELKDCPGMKEKDIPLPPKFGYVVECTGPGTLGQFFERNGMEW
jgi:hypothetical protein